MCMRVLKFVDELIGIKSLLTSGLFTVYKKAFVALSCYIYLPLHVIFIGAYLKKYFVSHKFQTYFYKKVTTYYARFQQTADSTDMYTFKPFIDNYNLGGFN